MFYEKTDARLRADIRYTRTGYYPHFHFQAEIVSVLSGTLRAVVDGKEHFLSAGDICVVFPYQFHEYEDIGETRTVVIVLSPEEFSEFDAVFHSKLPKNPVVKDETGALRALSLRLAECMSGEVSEKDGAPVPPPMKDGLSSYRSALAKGYGLLLLGALLPSVEFAEINRMEIPALQKILHYCVENFTRELSLDVLAKELHMNKHFISKLINGALSMSFTGYLNMIRIYAAQEKMERCEKTMNISEIAYSCGFSSIRSFNRNFLRLTGMSPSDYIERHHPSQNS